MKKGRDPRIRGTKEIKEGRKDIRYNRRKEAKEVKEGKE